MTIVSPPPPRCSFYLFLLSCLTRSSAMFLTFRTMRTYYFIFLVTIEMASCLAPTPHIDWCLYWRYFNKDQFRPECNGVYRLRFAKHKGTSESERQPIKTSYFEPTTTESECPPKCQLPVGHLLRPCPNSTLTSTRIQ